MMKALSSLGIGLSLVFGCLLLALVAELYYLLWWKKRIPSTEIEDEYSSSTKELFYLLCWKKPTTLSSRALNSRNLARLPDAQVHESDEHHLHSNSGMDFLFKPLGEDTAEAELMRLHNLSGPPRFLFTIKEETKEDMESDDGKPRGDNKSTKGPRSKSLSDLLLAVESPYVTPLSSPHLTSPLTPLDRYNQHGFNPLFESSTEAELKRIWSSPPPKFKFLKDAEDKLYRKILMERSVRTSPPRPSPVSSSPMASDQEGSFITILIDQNKEKEHHHSSSQVLPLTSSPTDVIPLNKKSIFS